jgi:hypothetical protein
VLISSAGGRSGTLAEAVMPVAELELVGASARGPKLLPVSIMI